MVLNAVTSTVLWDKDFDVTLLVTGAFSSANSSNTIILKANTVQGANSSMVCLLDVAGIQYSTSIANGWVALEFSNTASNVNTTIGVWGRNASGVQEGYIRANTAQQVGDLNLNLSGLSGGDSFTLVISLRKADFNGAYSNVSIPWNTPPYSNQW